ncbi:MAG: sigma-70 family RNA polymerase sigma factor [Bacteroidales bacterium]|jgi:RNA polymerase sigma-70 factor (ECF subfamily)|nr:sigma-70 family RNA polymerase sigma factor [Bacteroidales bacterium]
MNRQENIYINIHQDIIDRCKLNEPKAQFQLYKLYYKAMFNTCLRIVNNNLEAEDIMQESFFKAFEKINLYRGEVSFGAWLKKIVVNHSLDELRKKKLDLLSLEEAKVNPVETTENTIEEEQEIQAKAEEIKEQINQLPDGYRIVLSLYLIEGYDHDEIGEILKITSSTSRSQCARARQKLLERIKNNKKEKIY